MVSIHQHDPLTRAAIRYGSDKYGGHLYTLIYNEVFAHLRDKQIRLLEIGVGGYEYEKTGGLSLKMWADYFPYAEITGLDIHRKSLSMPPRIKVVHGSQTDESLLATLTAERGPFDIIIDDGSHVVDHQISSFFFLYPKISPNGLYAIEDIQTSFSEALGGHADGADTVFTVASKIALSMHKLEGYRNLPEDDRYTELGRTTHSVSIYRNVVLFRRGTNTYPSNMGLDLANSEASEVFESISAEAAINPSPGSFLSRIDMMIWASRPAEAAALALEAAERYPHDVALFEELVRMMRWAKSEEIAAAFEARLAKLVG